jgi:hypothetical protein
MKVFEVGDAQEKEGEAKDEGVKAKECHILWVGLCASGTGGIIIVSYGMSFLAAPVPADFRI